MSALRGKADISSRSAFGQERTLALSNVVDCEISQNNRRKKVTKINPHKLRRVYAGI